MENQLVEVVKQSGLEVTQSEKLLNGFKGYFEQAKEWEIKAKAIIVTDEEQLQEMQDARVGRLAVKKMRCDVENTRKTNKEQSLREGKAIDGMANIIKAILVPIEEHLEKQEKFIPLLIEAKKEKRLAGRREQLSKYVEDVELYDLKDMSVAGFEELLKNSKFAYDEKLKAEKQVEDDRIAKEIADEKARKELEIENTKLKKEADDREANLAKEREAQTAKDKIESDKQKKLQDEIDAKNLAEENRLKKEFEDKAKADAELKAQQEADAQSKKDSELAPDKDKLALFSNKLSEVNVPPVESEEAKTKLNEAIKLIAQAQVILKSL